MGQGEGVDRHDAGGNQLSRNPLGQPGFDLLRLTLGAGADDDVADQMMLTVATVVNDDRGLLDLGVLSKSGLDLADLHPQCPGS